MRSEKEIKEMLKKELNDLHSEMSTNDIINFILEGEPRYSLFELKKIIMSNEMSVWWDTHPAKKYMSLSPLDLIEFVYREPVKVKEILGEKK